MSIVPTHKQDFESCERLALASDEEVVSQLRDLLEWLQDWNWPVARPVAQRIRTIGVPLVAPVKEILVGPDDIWKYWVVNSLLPGAEREVIESLRPSLERIVSAPTSGEIAEDVVEGAAQLLANDGARV